MQWSDSVPRTCTDRSSCLEKTEQLLLEFSSSVYLHKCFRIKLQGFTKKGGWASCSTFREAVHPTPQHSNYCLALFTTLYTNQNFLHDTACPTFQFSGRLILLFTHLAFVAALRSQRKRPPLSIVESSTAVGLSAALPCSDRAPRDWSVLPPPFGVPVSSRCHQIYIFRSRRKLRRKFDRFR